MAKRKVDDVVHGKVSPGELAHFIDIDPDKIFLKVVGNKRLDANVRASVTDGHVEDSIDKTPEFSITIHDPDWELLNSGAMSRAVDVNVGNRWYRLNAVDVSDDDVTCTFIVRNAAYLMAHNKRRTANRKNTTRAEFILSLVRSVKKARIPFVCHQLHQIQSIEPVTLNRRGERRDKGLPRGKDARGITVKGTPADSEQLSNMEAVVDEGVQANGPYRALVGAIMCIIQESTARRSATAGQFVGLFQQSSRYGWPATRDPHKDAPAFYKQFIPIVRANPHADLGTLIAKVQGPLHPEEYALGCDRWRAEAEKVVKEYAGLGKSSGGSGTPGLRYNEYKKRYNFEVQQNGDGTNENYLAAIYRLAEEVNWSAFWVNDELHFESEEDLFKSKFRMRILRDDVETISASIDEHRKANEMTISQYIHNWYAPVGSVVVFGPPPGTTMIAGANVHDNPLNGRWLVTNIRRPINSGLAEITLSKPIPESKEPAPEIGIRQIDDGSGGIGNNLGGGQGALGGAGTIDTTEGSRGIVDSALFLAQAVGGSKIYLVSDYRAGSTTTSGNVSDHSSNSEWRAARDIGHRGTNALTGPPTHDLDMAAVAIGEAFGRKYKMGQTIIDTFHWEGFRIQILWRTPLYGGHKGHIHVGSLKLGATKT